MNIYSVTYYIGMNIYGSPIQNSTHKIIAKNKRDAINYVNKKFKVTSDNIKNTEADLIERAGKAVEIWGHDV